MYRSLRLTSKIASLTNCLFEQGLMNMLGKKPQQGLPEQVRMRTIQKI
jgi:hypothetical protein